MSEQIRNEETEEELRTYEEMSTEEKMLSLIYLLSRYARVATLDARTVLNGMIPDLVELISDLFPRIIAVYDDPRMSEYAEDKNYWISQLGRIMNCLESDDILHQADVLYYETCKNIQEFLNILDEKGVTL